MRLLLDTHVAIWAINIPERIPAEVHAAIENPANDVFVSVATIWEIAIKYPLRRADSPPASAYQAIAEFESADFELLDINAGHAAFVEKLPPIHADPFDRLILAQALVENLQLVTLDRHLSRYDVAMLTWS